MAIKLGSTTTEVVNQINKNESGLDKKANLSGGNTFSGNQVITGYLDIRGTAAEKHLKTRGIGGSDGNGKEQDLYLQYGSDYKTLFGKTGQSSLNSDGSISINGKKAATTDDVNGKYTKPSTGIPESDLASTVQESLKKADSAIQSHQSLANYVTKNGEETIAGKKNFTANNNFTNENKFTNATYTPTFTDIANGVGKSSCFTRGVFMQAYMGQIIAPNASLTDATRAYAIESDKLKFQRITKTEVGHPTLETMATLTKDGMYLGTDNKKVATVDQIVETALLNPTKTYLLFKGASFSMRSVKSQSGTVTIEWGDFTASTYASGSTSISHTYTDGKEYHQIAISGYTKFTAGEFEEVDIISAIFGNDVTEFSGTFWDCPTLESVIFPDSVTSIGGSTFNGCTILKNITIPSSVTLIRNYAFAHSGLEEIRFLRADTDGLVIESQSFYNCRNLERIIVPKNAYSEYKTLFSSSGHSDLIDKIVYETYSNDIPTVNNTKHSQTQITNGDLDDLFGESAVGWYSVLGGLTINNAPPNGKNSGFSVEVLQSGSYYEQRAIVNSSGKTYTRLRLANGEWDFWKEVMDCHNNQVAYGRKSFYEGADIPGGFQEVYGGGGYIFSICDSNHSTDNVFGVRYDDGGDDTATVIIGEGNATAPLEVGGSVGTAGQVLMSQGANKTPKWANISGGSSSGSVQIRVQTSKVYLKDDTNEYYINLNIAIISGKEKLMVGDKFQFCRPHTSKEPQNRRVRRRWKMRDEVVLTQDMIDGWTNDSQYAVVKLPVIISVDGGNSIEDDLQRSYTNNTNHRVPFIVRVQRPVHIKEGVDENRTISNHCQIATKPYPYTADGYSVYNYILRPL